MTAKDRFLPPHRQAILPAWILREIDRLFPGSFALVMATGILSNAFYFEGPRQLSACLLAINLAFYLWLLAATVVRVLRAPRAVWDDLTDPGQVFAFFTLIAATDVLGVGILLRGFDHAAILMWLAALLLWMVLIYVSFGALTFLNTGHRADVVQGGWLIAIVATESLAVLGTLIAGRLGAVAPLMFFLAHAMWGVGLALYGIYVTLFAQRVFFREVAPDDISPLLWVVMGAAAISTNAGAVLASTESQSAYLQAMRGFIDGVTLITWSWATWWIPLLVLLGVWKHGVHRVPLTYTPVLWAMVFPLGMYALASLRLSHAAGLPLLSTVSAFMAWIALAAWAATAGGLALSSWRAYRDFVGATSRVAI